MATTTDLSCYEGEALTLNVGPAAGQLPTDITGWSITFILADSTADGATVRATKTIGSGITVTNASGGLFAIALLTAETNQTPGVYAFSTRRTNAGFETELAEGTLTIKGSAGA